MTAIRAGQLMTLVLSVTQLIVAQYVTEDGTCVTLTGLEGRCVPLPDCLKTLAARIGAPNRAGLRQGRVRARQTTTRCIFPNVCCESSFEIGTRNDASVQPVAVGLRHPGVALLPLDSCGESSQDMIVQGDRAASGQFPWMALVCYPGGLTAGEKCVCGGSLISSRFVLTAAHCVTNLKPLGTQPPSLVLLGVEERDSCEGSTCDVLRLHVDRVLPHPGYEVVRSRQNDIALLRLARPVDKNLENISPICLPVGNIQFKSLEKVRELIVAGWGDTDTRPGRHQFPGPALMFTGLREVPRSECAEVYHGQQPIASSQICASHDHHGACKGDSGGPLMMVDTVPWSATPRMVQVGVVSFGPMPCGKPGEPAVFTRVAHFLDWILRTMESA